MNIRPFLMGTSELVHNLTPTDATVWRTGNMTAVASANASVAKYEVTLVVK